MSIRTVLATLACALMPTVVAHADEGKDESGKGRQRNEERQREGRRDDARNHDWRNDERGGRGAGRDSHGSYFHQHGYTRIPNGHLPPPGECRIWYPDRPAGQQPPPFRCGQGRPAVQPGGWMLSPGPQPGEVQAVVYDVRRPGVVIDVAIFDARTGTMLRVTGGRPK
jgi:hypothetical protein